MGAAIRFTERTAEEDRRRKLDYRMQEVVLMQPAKMSVSVESKGTCRLVRIDGDIDSISSPELELTFSSLRENDEVTYIVDLKSVGYISSMGLRVFLSHLKKTRPNGSRVVLVGANELVLDVFRMSGFTSFFEFRADIDSALAELA
ncbi:MAG: STAS domain-containing protein [Synechococcaceae cyanobacterium ELA445]